MVSTASPLCASAILVRQQYGLNRSAGSAPARSCMTIAIGALLVFGSATVIFDVTDGQLPASDISGVNILAPPKARLGIEIVHDLVCPWCFLGVRRLMRTLRRRPDLLFDLTWRPFLLNPDMPRAGMARPDYVIRKFGGEDRARRLYASISDIGRTEGVQFRFDRIRRTPSSVDAHRLVRYAARFGQADAMVEALFSAHFTDGLDIGDHAPAGRHRQRLRPGRRRRAPVPRQR